MSASNRSTKTSRPFTISRTLDAPLKRVWQAWSEPEQLQAWWGPKGCMIKVAKLEFRPGGFFHYAMQFRGGQDMWARFLFREISAPGRISWLNSFSNEGCGITRAPFEQMIPLEILNEVSMTEEAGRTTLAFRASPHGATEEEIAVFDNMFASLNDGYSGTIDRLTEHLVRK